MEQYYKIVGGVDQDGNPTTFKVEIPQSEIDKIRVFDIIVKKNVDLPLLKRCGNVVSYNSQVFAGQTLSLDEFNFLKGVCCKC